MLSINTNNQQSFGMAYRFADKKAVSTSKAIAKEIQESGDVRRAQEYFAEKLVKPLQELTTEVVADNEKVFVTHPISGEIYYMVDSAPWAPKEGYGRGINYKAKKLVQDSIGGEDTTIYTWHSKPQNGIGSLAWDATYLYNSPITRKHIAALEIGREFDKQAAAMAEQKAREVAKYQATEQTAKFLQDLVG